MSSPEPLRPPLLPASLAGLMLACLSTLVGIMHNGAPWSILTRSIAAFCVGWIIVQVGRAAVTLLAPPEASATGDNPATGQRRPR